MRIPIVFFLLACIITGCRQKNHKAESSFLFPYYDRGDIGPFAKYKYKAGYIDIKGHKVIGNTFIDAEPFTDGLGCVGVKTEHGVQYGYIDSTGTLVIPPVFKRARPFHEGFAWVWQDQEHKWGLINKKGAFITDQVYSQYSTDFYKGSGIAYVEQGSTEPSGFEKTLVHVFSVGLLQASDDAYYHCYQIDTNGRVSLLDSNTYRTTRAYEILLQQQNGLGKFINENDLYGFKKISLQEFEPDKNSYTNEGTIALEPVYKYAEDFLYGYARVTFKNGEKGYIDPTGKVIVRFREDRPY